MASARTLLSDGRAIKVHDGSLIIQMAGEPSKIRIPCRSQRDARRIRSILLTAARKNIARAESRDQIDSLYNTTMMAFVQRVDQRRREFIGGKSDHAEEPVQE